MDEKQAWEVFHAWYKQTKPLCEKDDFLLGRVKDKADMPALKCYLCGTLYYKNTEQDISKMREDLA